MYNYILKLNLIDNILSIEITLFYAREHLCYIVQTSKMYTWKIKIVRHIQFTFWGFFLWKKRNLASIRIGHK